MAPIRLSPQDIEAIQRTVQSEIGHWKGDALSRGAGLNVDVILNRAAIGKGFGGNTVQGVINHPAAFSAINGVGSWDKLPPASKKVQDAVNARLDQIQGGATLAPVTHFANPVKSSPKNQAGWVKAMQNSDDKEVITVGKDNYHVYGRDPSSPKPPAHVQIDFGGGNVREAAVAPTIADARGANTMIAGAADRAAKTVAQNNAPTPGDISPMAFGRQLANAPRVNGGLLAPEQLAAVDPNKVVAPAGAGPIQTAAADAANAPKPGLLSRIGSSIADAIMPSAAAAESSPMNKFKSKVTRNGDSWSVEYKNGEGVGKDRWGNSVIVDRNNNIISDPLDDPQMVQIKKDMHPNGMPEYTMKDARKAAPMGRFDPKTGETTAIDMSSGKPKLAPDMRYGGNPDSNPDMRETRDRRALDAGNPPLPPARPWGEGNAPITQMQPPNRAPLPEDFSYSNPPAGWTRAPGSDPNMPDGLIRPDGSWFWPEGHNGEKFPPRDVLVAAGARTDFAPERTAAPTPPPRPGLLTDPVVTAKPTPPAPVPPSPVPGPAPVPPSPPASTTAPIVSAPLAPPVAAPPVATPATPATPPVIARPGLLSADGWSDPNAPKQTVDLSTALPGLLSPGGPRPNITPLPAQPDVQPDPALYGSDGAIMPAGALPVPTPMPNPYDFVRNGSAAGGVAMPDGTNPTPLPAPIDVATPVQPPVEDTTAAPAAPLKDTGDGSYGNPWLEGSTQAKWGAEDAKRAADADLADKAKWTNFIAGMTGALSKFAPPGRAAGPAVSSVNAGIHAPQVGAGGAGMFKLTPTQLVRPSSMGPSGGGYRGLLG